MEEFLHKFSHRKKILCWKVTYMCAVITNSCQILVIRWNDMAATTNIYLSQFFMRKRNVSTFVLKRIFVFTHSPTGAKCTVHNCGTLRMHRTFLWYDRKIAFEPMLRVQKMHFGQYKSLSMGYVMYPYRPIYTHNCDSNRHRHKQIQMLCFYSFAINDRIHACVHIHLDSIPAGYTN